MNECGSTTSISTLHPDIIQTHILSRLDCSTLASVAATCSELNGLVSQEDVWANLCRSTWPSTGSPRVRGVIQSFPNGSRSFFSDAYTVPRPITTTPGNSHMNLELTPQLIFAVDLYYREQLILSRVAGTETVSEGFRSKLFEVDMLEPKDVVPTPMKYTRDLKACLDIVRELRLSCIVIDPSGKRAVNLLNQNADTIQSDASRELTVLFPSMIQESEEVVCFCGWLKLVGAHGGEMQVREGKLKLLKRTNGRDSLLILQRVLEGKMETKNEWRARIREGKRLT
ncbi:hypothetical protein K1719_006938 [Acacia pycnantha]|nr:hypothetical protein K1719_006938 [Acacia pycnantha]